MEAFDLFLACHQTLIEKFLLLCLPPLLIVVHQSHWYWLKYILQFSLLLEKTLNLVLLLSYFGLLSWCHPCLIYLDRLTSLGA